MNSSMEIHKPEITLAIIQVESEHTIENEFDSSLGSTESTPLLIFTYSWNVPSQPRNAEMTYQTHPQMENVRIHTGNQSGATATLLRKTDFIHLHQSISLEFLHTPHTLVPVRALVARAWLKGCVAFWLDILWMHPTSCDNHLSAGPRITRNMVANAKGFSEAKTQGVMSLNHGQIAGRQVSKEQKSSLEV